MRRKINLKLAKQRRLVSDRERLESQRYAASFMARGLRWTSLAARNNPPTTTVFPKGAMTCRCGGMALYYLKDIHGRITPLCKNCKRSAWV